MKLNSFLPPVCIPSTTNPRMYYIIAGGEWIEVDRMYDREELNSLWVKHRVSRVVPVVLSEKTYKVKGSKGNQYIISNKNGKWHCTCPSFMFHRHSDCKHIAEVKLKEKTKSK